MRNEREAAEQAAVFEWAAWMTQKYPPLRFMHHIPNGGARDARTGAMLKRQGVKPGVPDIYLPCPCGGFHGCYIEMKVGKNRLTPAQREFLDYADSVGYATAVCYSARDAEDLIQEYMKGRREWGKYTS